MSPGERGAINSLCNAPLRRSVGMVKIFTKQKTAKKIECHLVETNSYKEKEDSILVENEEWLENDDRPDSFLMEDQGYKSDLFKALSKRK
jgi:hypothetical protein